MLLAISLWDGLACGAAGALAGFVISRIWDYRAGRSLDRRCRAQLEAAGREAEGIKEQARNEAHQSAAHSRAELEQSFAARRRDLDEAAGRLAERETLVNRQLETLLERETDLQERIETADAQARSAEKTRADLDRLTTHCRAELQRVARLSCGEAREILLKQTEKENLRDSVELSRRTLDRAKSSAEEQARRIISIAIQRYAPSQAAETTSATIALQSDELKGRIIGREGRNIRAFEAATGVTVLIDDTPGAVVLSAFDPVRREVARETMLRLIQDGRIHPARIEELVAAVTAELDESILKAGQDAVHQLGLPSLHPELVKLLGRLKYRRSYAQNILEHSIEVAHLTSLLASELGLDTSLAKRAGLLHDIGKALDHQIEGSHAHIGAEFARRYGEPEEIVNGIASHHDEVPHTGLWGILVSAADAISASRPGARSESTTLYIKRLEDLERIGKSFPGVEKCFAVQAGRELRVLVHPDAVNDERAFTLARSIARKIEDELQYPGQIRVTVIRETRCVEFAK